MSKPPAFQFYVKDWRSSQTVRKMSAADRGHYIDLLCAFWDSEEPGILPFDPDLIAKYAILDPRVVKKFLRKYETSFSHVGDKLVCQKLRDQWLRYEELRTKRQKAAFAMRAHAEQVLCSAPSPAVAVALSTSQDTKREAQYNKATPPKANPPQAALDFPDWFPIEAWNGFAEMRKKLRKPLTPYATKRLIAKLEKFRSEGQDPKEILDQSTCNGWQGIFELREQVNGQRESWKERETRERNELLARMLAKEPH